MWRGFIAITALMLTGCGAAAEPHAYPASAQSQFNASCPRENAVCGCTWDRITRTLPYEEYEAALERFREDGLMDPRVTRARTHCIEHHHS